MVNHATLLLTWFILQSKGSPGQWEWQFASPSAFPVVSVLTHTSLVSVLTHTSLVEYGVKRQVGLGVIAHKPHQYRRCNRMGATFQVVMAPQKWDW